MSETNQIPAVSPVKEPSSFRLISALAIAGLFSGILLATTYSLTLPRIQANKEAALKNAIFAVLPGSADYIILKRSGDTLEEVRLGAGDNQNEEEIVYAGYNTMKELTGFAIPGEEPGFQDIIGVIVGYDPVLRSIIGFEVLESKETPGLGDKIFKDMDFQQNFTMLKVEPEILVVKKGQKTRDNEVEAITGATISSKAVVVLLNKSMGAWVSVIDNYMKKNDIKLAGHGAKK
ncbi:MAG: FMN-binding protein [Cyclobacteriaceae bacterium]|nr:FMN-binding protein [Cyclobacteriaceae bacterium]